MGVNMAGAVKRADATRRPKDTYGAGGGRWPGRQWDGQREHSAMQRASEGGERSGRAADDGGESGQGDGAVAAMGMEAERRRDERRESRARGAQEPPSTSRNPNPRGAPRWIFGKID